MGEVKPCAPSPLLLAIAVGDDSLVSLLQEANAEEPQLKPHSTSFAAAFRNHDLSDVVRFLARRADPNFRLRRGEGVRDTGSGTPLHALCAMHHQPGAVAVVELLLRLRADAGASDAEGDSPLAHARYFGATDIYSVLEDRGAKLQGPYYSAVHRAGR